MRASVGLCKHFWLLRDGAQVVVVVVAAVVVVVVAAAAAVVVGGGGGGVVVAVVAVVVAIQRCSNGSSLKRALVHSILQAGDAKYVEARLLILFLTAVVSNRSCSTRSSNNNDKNHSTFDTCDNEKYDYYQFDQQ